jgi:hypothetical protein
METTNPGLPDYQLTLRRAFLTYGLPEMLTLDHGTVFYDNTTPSPFPTRLHLWLLALGIQVRFTRKRCPTDHAIIERTHQTMTAQALLGQTYPSSCALWSGLDECREVLNHRLPSRALSHQAPLEAYPHAIHSGRTYRPEWEEELLAIEKVCAYLVQGRWFRSIRSNGFFDLEPIPIGLQPHAIQYKRAFDGARCQVRSLGGIRGQHLSQLLLHPFSPCNWLQQLCPWP